MGILYAEFVGNCFWVGRCFILPSEIKIPISLCEEVCPKQIPVADIIRCTRYYHDAEHTPDVAAWEYKDMHCSHTIEKCDNCGACVKACPQNIAVRDELSRAQSM